MPSRPGLTRAVIAEKAGQLADEIGLDKLTLSLVAERLGVRTPSLYNHVAGLDRLRRELSLNGTLELDRRLQRAALGKSGDDALRSMLWAYRLFAKDRPGLYQALLRAPDGEDAEMQLAAKGIVDTVLTVLEPYQLDVDDAIHIVRGFRAIGHGFVALEVAGGFGFALNADVSYERLISTFLLGLNTLRGTGPGA